MENKKNLTTIHLRTTLEFNLINLVEFEEEEEEEKFLFLILNASLLLISNNFSFFVVVVVIVVAKLIAIKTWRERKREKNRVGRINN